MLCWLSVIFLQILYLLARGESSGSAYVKSRGCVYHKNDMGHIHTLVWAVELLNERNHSAVADRIGLVNLGQVGHLRNHVLFAHPLHLLDEGSVNHSSQEQIYQEYVRIREDIENELMMLDNVHWFQQEVFRKRVKRSLNITDPMFPQQWHLVNHAIKGMDINVSALWERNITGEGVTVCIIDDGLEWNNPDLRDNYNPDASWDLNDDDPDPSPAKDGKKNEHGTRCAGEVAAAANGVCGVGVAFRAKISGIKVLDGKMTDSLEATAFTKKMQYNNIYSCSWGPEDDGKTIDGPHYLSRLSMEQGTRVGRNGYGSIYVVASGNGGMSGDDCNFDGYANSIYTITIGAADEYGQKPFYAEGCACIMAVTFSSGSKPARGITTTDWTDSSANGCTDQHSGTSAAAPLAAGVIALALQVNPCLSWRDVQYLIILTSVKVEASSEWVVNAAGLQHSYGHGFGLISAWRLVNTALVWNAVPSQTTFATGYARVGEEIPHSPSVLRVNYTVRVETIGSYFLWVMEHVQLRVTIRHSYRGRLSISLLCPSRTKSLVAPPRPNDDSKDGFDQYTFSTVRCWGESPIGNWSLEVTDTSGHNESSGELEEWELVIHGTEITAADFESRKRLVEEAASGKYLNDVNFRAVCSPPPMKIGANLEVLSAKGLKILCLVGGFLTLLAIFETIEYLLCYDDEKKKFAEELDATNGNQPNNHRRHCEDDMKIASGEVVSLLDCDSSNGNEITPGDIHNNESYENGLASGNNESFLHIQGHVNNS